MNVFRFIAKHLSSPKGISGRVVSFFMNWQIRPMYKETIRVLSLSDGESILDIGCGNGFVMNMVAKEYCGSFVGVDISESIIKSALNRNRRFVESGQMAFSCQDMNSMSFDDNSFSRVYTINTVYFWDNIANAMKEISRILKPEGVFVNTLFTNETLDGYPHTKYGYKRYTEKELTEAGLDAGLAVDKIPIINGKALCLVYKKTPHRRSEIQ